MTTTISTIKGRLNREVAAFLKKSRLKNYHIEVNEKITYDEFLTNKMLIIAAIRTGIPYSLFDLIRDYTPFSENDWANFFDISTKSLQRYKSSSGHNFKTSHSEKIIEIAEVTNIGIDVFGNLEKFKLWLNTPNYALGKLKPIELLKDSYGKELVIKELIHVNHGYYTGPIVLISLI